MVHFNKENNWFHYSNTVFDFEENDFNGDVFLFVLFFWYIAQYEQCFYVTCRRKQPFWKLSHIQSNCFEDLIVQRNNPLYDCNFQTFVALYCTNLNVSFKSYTYRITKITMSKQNVLLPKSFTQNTNDFYSKNNEQYRYSMVKFPTENLRFNWTWYERK